MTEYRLFDDDESDARKPSGKRRFMLLAASNVLAAGSLLGLVTYSLSQPQISAPALRRAVDTSITGTMAATETPPAARKPRARVQPVSLTLPDRAPPTVTDTAIEAARKHAAPVLTESRTGAVRPARIIRVNRARKQDAWSQAPVRSAKTVLPGDAARPLEKKPVAVTHISPRSSFDLANAVPDKPRPIGGSLVRRTAPAPVKKTAKKAVPAKKKAEKPEKAEKKLSRKERLAKARQQHRKRAEYCLTTAIYYEARNESRAGQQAVAQVIMNRKRHKLYPNTVCGVVFQNDHMRNRCQFSFACDGRPERPKRNKAWLRARAIARATLNGRIRKSRALANATHYHATYVRPKWASRLTRVKRIGQHIFYKMPAGIRTASRTRRGKNGRRVARVQGKRSLFASLFSFK